jgi:hypothetical protein
MPNPIQVQLRTFFWGYDNGWAFPFKLLDEYRQNGTTPFPFHNETSFFIGYVYLPTWRPQQWTDVIGHALRCRLNRFDLQTLDNSGLGPIQEYFDSSDGYRSDFRSFKHEDIRLIEVTFSPSSSHKQPNIHPVSTARNNPVQASGSSAPKQKHI